MPAELMATFDFRITTSTDVKEFEEMLMKWVAESEEGETDSGRITLDFNCVCAELFLVILYCLIIWDLLSRLSYDHMKINKSSAYKLYFIKNQRNNKKLL